jgi:hypothetical protein
MPRFIISFSTPGCSVFVASFAEPTALPDGMRCDNDGNLYVAMVGLGRILVVGSGESLLAMIRTIGASPSNVHFRAGWANAFYHGRGTQPHRKSAPAVSWQRMQDFKI